MVISVTDALSTGRLVFLSKTVILISRGFMAGLTEQDPRAIAMNKKRTVLLLISDGVNHTFFLNNEKVITCEGRKKYDLLQHINLI